jgi:DNA invertase Pin-like site-specific DNA recombinase
VKNKQNMDNLQRENRRVIVRGYHYLYVKKILTQGREKYGSLRQLGFALGISSATIHRWYNNESEMGKKWVESLESLLHQG